MAAWFKNLSLHRAGNQPVRTLKSKTKTRKSQDPYAVAQSRQRKAANISRQQQLKEKREASLGDPVNGNPTPFTQSLTAPSPPLDLKSKPADSTAHYDANSFNVNLNHYLTREEVDRALSHAEKLSRPVKSSNSGVTDPQKETEEARLHEEEHNNALEAIRRIVQLGNGNNKDRMRVNIQRAIEAFGRHNTDQTLPPRLESVVHSSAPNHPPPAPRAGRDTGSSEVQIAILTTKIINMTQQLKTTSHKDKHNKRNLRILVHRRQKLLKYLRAKERGGPRWQHVMESLGLSEASWKGEISM